MAQLPVTGNPDRDLNQQDYKPSGELRTVDASVALVNGCATAAENFITGKQ